MSHAIPQGGADAVQLCPHILAAQLAAVVACAEALLLSPQLTVLQALDPAFHHLANAPVAMDIQSEQLVLHLESQLERLVSAREFNRWYELKTQPRVRRGKGQRALCRGNESAAAGGHGRSIYNACRPQIIGARRPLERDPAVLGRLQGSTECRHQQSLRYDQEAPGGDLESARSAWLNESLDRLKVELEKFKEKMKLELDTMLQRKDAAHRALETIYFERSDSTSTEPVGGGLVHEELKAMLKDHMYSGWLHSILSDSIAASDADRIAKFDFALESAGGSVLIKHCSPTYATSQSSISLFGVPVFYLKTAPNSIIQPQVYPGDCWAFEGSKGHTVIKLVTKAFINGVTLEHIPKEISLNDSRTSSPKDFSVWGMHDEEDEGKLLGSFTYSLDGSPIQEFPVYNTQEPYTHVKFQFFSNHGNPEYTCVYRVRVHGHLPPPQ
eukprot:Em0005g1473a